jgi:oligoendopeptidase F
MVAIPENTLQWSDYEGRYAELASTELSSDNVQAWLQAWSDLHDELDELGSRIYVAKTVNTADEASSKAYDAFLSDIYPPMAQAEQGLKTLLLASALEPAGFEVPLRNMRSEAALFRDENVPLQSEEMSVSSQYADIVGAQTVQWDGEERTVTQLSKELQGQDRARRETAWRTISTRQLEDRQAINEVWSKLLALRLPQAAHAGYPDYRTYRWEQFQRFDYTPEDCRRFHDAILSEVVPLAAEMMEARRTALGVETLRPWDLDVDPAGREGLRPFNTVDEFIEKTQSAIDKVDAELGAYYRTMRDEGLLDLENRKNKAPGGYCTTFAKVRLPFIFMNAVGKQSDVRTLVHELGHAFHAFEAGKLPLSHQQSYNIEFAEVASMSMELLAGTFMRVEDGSFYDEESFRRAWTEHIQKVVLFFPYMAVVDAFQHWVYANPEAAANPAKCDAEWSALYGKFLPWEDWTGFESALATGWHRKLHIHEIPFYYVEYGIAQLGALQVYANFRRDRAAAVRDYRNGLALGGTVTLPEMFAAAGAKFAFDADTVRGLMSLCREVLAENAN